MDGQSLVAGDVDIETGGGGINIRKLMGTYVHVSSEDTEPASPASGAVRIGAVYADSLHLVTGEACWLPGSAPFLVSYSAKYIAMYSQSSCDVLLSSRSPCNEPVLSPQKYPLMASI